MLRAYSTIFMHVDFDAFFASVEQVLNQELAGKPVIVVGLATDRSVVACPSYEARAFGVRTGMPLAQARRLCPQATFLRGSFKRYAQLSEKAFTIFRRYTPMVEMTSVDEGYLDLTGCTRLYISPVSEIAPCRSESSAATSGSDFSADTKSGCVQAQPAGSWMEVAEEIRKEIKEKTGLNVSIGIGSNKLIAKVATRLAKPNGIVQVYPGREREFIAPMPVRAIPGIGPRTEELLHRFNVKTVGELGRMPPAWFAGTFGVAGEAFHLAAAGIDESPIFPPGPPKSISRETTFEADTADPGTIEGMLYYLLERAANEMRLQRMRARTVAVRVRYANFETVSKSKRLRRATDLDGELYDTVLFLLKSAHARRTRVRLVGVTLADLSTNRFYQEGLFERSSYERRRRLYGSIDAIRARYGFGALVAGRAINLMADHRRDAEGFHLRTSCLTR